MQTATRTSTRLLDGLCDSRNAEAWWEFDARYRPIVAAVARRSGLRDADADEVAQDTMARFVRAYQSGGYDRTRGRLRSWLVGIARCRIAEHRAASRRRAPAAAVDPADVPDEPRLEAYWLVERRLAILRRGLDVVASASRTSPRTVRAFEMLAFEGRTVAEVAATLDMTDDDVYQAKHRIATRVRQVVAELDAAYDDGGADERTP